MATDDMNQKIQQAINESLPAQVGDLLKKRLAQADEDARQLTITRDLLKDEKERARLLGVRVAEIDTREGEAAAREAKVTDRERSIQQRENAAALNELKVQLAEQRVADAKAIVLAVFANNRMKYSEQTATPFLTIQNGYPTTTSGYGTKEVQSEG